MPLYNEGRYRLVIGLRPFRAWAHGPEDSA